MYSRILINFTTACQGKNRLRHQPIHAEKFSQLVCPLMYLHVHLPKFSVVLVLDNYKSYDIKQKKKLTTSLVFCE